MVGLVCALPWLAWAEEDLSRDEAKQKLDQTEQKLQSSRAKEQGLTADLAALAEERAKLNSDLIEAGKSVQASEAKLSETEAKLGELTDQVNVIQSSITERKEAIVKMLSAMQRIGRTPPPAFVTRRDDALAVELFVAGRGVNLAARDAQGRTALDIAKARGNTQIAQLLSRSLPAAR